MASIIQITCVHRTNRREPHARIQYLGGRTAEGQPWHRSLPLAITDIESGACQYYVHVNRNSLWVTVAKHDGNKYLKTQNDVLQPTSLLGLRECM